MCGIAGAYDLTGRRIFPRDAALAMTRSLAHRGPDDEGIHHEPGLFLGARRLAIVDLAGGSQPIANEDGSVWVAFNGELFDYPELRATLESRGHRLATRCDTEAWVHLYEDHGPADLWERVKGQFAVSLWDRRTRTLLLGRDRIGICPLHYAFADGWLLWASEIRALLASGMVEAKADLRGIDHFFNFFTVGSATRTCFEDIRLLGPGQRVLVRDGRADVAAYWDLDFPDAGDERREGDPRVLVDELEQLIRHAVRRRLRGDVPVTSYISGGLDSTTVLGTASQESRSPIPAFTIALDRAGPDERAQARESADLLGSPLTTVEMNRGAIADAYPELIRAAEAPVFDTTCACLLRLAQRVRGEGFKVVLTGEGADEALAGYAWFKDHAARQRSASRLGPFGGASLAVRRWLRLGRVSLDSTRRPPARAIRGMRTAQQETYDLFGQTRSLLYGQAMWDRLGDHSAYDDLGIGHQRFARWHPLNQSLYVGYKVMLAGMLLAARGDRIAMNASVEARYPLLDEDVVAFCATLDPTYKLRGTTDKWLLREVARKVLPAPIANRPKTMFHATFAGTFLRPDQPAWVGQLLTPESLNRAGYFDPRRIARATETWRRAQRTTPRGRALDMGLTLVVATQLWHHTFLGGRLCDLPTWERPGC